MSKVRLYDGLKSLKDGRYTCPVCQAFLKAGPAEPYVCFSCGAVYVRHGTGIYVAEDGNMEHLFHVPCIGCKDGRKAVKGTDWCADCHELNQGLALIVNDIFTEDEIDEMMDQFKNQESEL